MGKEKVEPKAKVPLFECGNCTNRWPEEELREVKRLSERVSPGEPMPAGEFRC